MDCVRKVQKNAKVGCDGCEVNVRAHQPPVCLPLLVGMAIGGVARQSKEELLYVKVNVVDIVWFHVGTPESWGGQWSPSTSILNNWGSQIHLSQWQSDSLQQSTLIGKVHLLWL